MNNEMDVAPLLLDSSLISQTSTSNKLKYDIKIIDCNNYIHVYKYKYSKFANNEKNFDNKKDIYKIDTDNLKKINYNDINIINLLNNNNLQNIIKNIYVYIYFFRRFNVFKYIVIKYNNFINLKKINIKAKTIKKDNLQRSKLKCQRIAKANANVWKSFITLTFEENLTDIKIANKKLNIYLTMVRRKFDDFKYLCVPEFQKRGAVHYHLLTNIPVNSELIPKRTLKKLWNKDLKKYKYLDYYDLKFWYNGFSSAEVVEGDIKKIVGYISKYMTKDVDDRLFLHHRYFNSKNLNMPKESYIDLSNEKHIEFLNNLLKNKKNIFTNVYINNYNRDEIIFEEYL